jgi:hypothetical protein
MRKLSALVLAFAALFACVALLSRPVEARARRANDKKKDKKKEKKLDHSPLHHAVRLLHEARANAVHPKYDHYGHHRHNAVAEIDRAIHQLREALRRARAHGMGEPGKGIGGPLPSADTHAPLHHALKLLRAAKATAGKPRYAEYGTHRHQAIVHMDHAMKQLHEAIKLARAHDRK